jgi:hypothetical protein
MNSSNSLSWWVNLNRERLLAEAYQRMAEMSAKDKTNYRPRTEDRVKPKREDEDES